MITAIETEYHDSKVPMVIIIKRVYGIKPVGDFRCYFDLILKPWGIHIYACKLYQGDQGNLWVRFPARQYRYQGQLKWGPVVEVEDAALREAVSLAARDALQSA